MKTIQEIAVECAARSEHSYTQVENFIPHNWVIEAMQEYAKQCCDEQIQACAENAESYMSNRGNPVVHKESVLNTPNVVTTKP